MAPSESTVAVSPSIGVGVSDGLGVGVGVGLGVAVALGVGVGVGVGVKVGVGEVTRVGVPVAVGTLSEVAAVVAGVAITGAVTEMGAVSVKVLVGLGPKKAPEAGVFAAAVALAGGCISPATPTSVIVELITGEGVNVGDNPPPAAAAGWPFVSRGTPARKKPAIKSKKAKA